MKTWIVSLVILICIIIFVANLPSAVSQINKVTIILYESYNIKQFNEGQQVKLEGQVIFRTPGKTTGLPGVYYKIIHQDTGKVIYDGYTKQDGTFAFTWSAEYFGKKETNLKAIFPGSGNFNYAESILTLEVLPTQPSPKLTYHNTFLSLQVIDGSSQGSIKVKPTLTYGSGSKLHTNDVSIYVDGISKTTVSSNQWSSNIYTGSGSHTIRAYIPEQSDSSDSSIKYRSSSDTVNFVSGSPKVTTYYDTQLSLQVIDGTSQGSIKVKPTLTYGSGNTLSTTAIKIYVDGISKTTVSSNQWSSNIYTGSGTTFYTIKANFPEQSDSSDSSIKYRSSSDIENYFVSGGGSSGDTFPVEYVIVGIIVIAVIAGIGVALSKRKKMAPIAVQSSGKINVTPAADDTQFWVCPRCGRDLQMKSGRQFCPSCNVYH